MEEVDAWLEAEIAQAQERKQRESAGKSSFRFEVRSNAVSMSIFKL
jgi:hypothetical protein